MGNRSNIVIRETATQTENCLILYSHWGGDDNLTAVENVLNRTDRIGDSAYLTAQIFHEFTQLGNYDGGLGYGLWVGDLESIDETDNPAVIVDADTGAITYQGLNVSPPCSDFAPDSFAPDYGDGIDGSLFCSTCLNHETRHTNPAQILTR